MKLKRLSLLLLTLALDTRLLLQTGAATPLNLRRSDPSLWSASPAAIEDAEEEAEDDSGSQEQEWQEESVDEVEEESTRLAQTSSQPRASATGAKWLPSLRNRGPRQLQPSSSAAVVVPASHARRHGEREGRLQLMAAHQKIVAKHKQLPHRINVNGHTMPPRTSLSTPEGMDGSADAEASNHSADGAAAIPGLPSGELATDTCNPPCVEGRGICNDKICFCQTPYSGVRCEIVQSFGPSRVSPGIAGLLVFLSVLAGAFLGVGIIKLFSSASAAATAPKSVSANRRAKETWRPK